MRDFLRKNFRLLLCVALISAPAWAQTGYQTFGALAYLSTCVVSSCVSGLGTGVATLLGSPSSGTGGPAGTASPTFTGTVTHPDGSTWTSAGLSGLVTELIGSSTSYSTGGVAPTFQVTGISTATTKTQLSRFSADASGPAFVSYKSRGATVGTEGAVQANDALLTLTAFGSDGATAGGILAGTLVFTPDTAFTTGSGVTDLNINLRNGASAGLVMEIDGPGNMYMGPSFHKIADINGLLYSGDGVTCAAPINPTTVTVRAGIVTHC